MSNHGDPDLDFEALDNMAAKWLNSLPKCDSCGEPIQDDPYHEIPFSGMKFRVCDSCLSSFKKWREE